MRHKHFRFQDNIHNMLTWFLSPKSKDLEREGRHVVAMTAENISLGYRNLCLDAAISSVKEIIVEELDDIEYLEKDDSYLRPVIELKQFARDELKDYLVDFLVHGSIATLDYSKGWSDLDTYLIIKDEIIQDKDSLVDLREKLLFAYAFLLRIDSHQHHGFLICTENDLSNYPSYYMPGEVLRYAKSLFSQNKIILNEIDIGERRLIAFNDLVSLFKETHETGVFRRHSFNGEYLLGGFKNVDNGLYQFKNYAGYLAISPAYFLQAIGRPVYKRESFHIVKNEFLGNSWKIIDKITAIRNEWPKREKFPCCDNRIPLWVQKIMGDECFKDGYEFTETLKNGLKDI